MPALACSADPPEPIVTAPIARLEPESVGAGANLERAAVDHMRGLEAELGLSPDGDFAALAEPDGVGGLRRVHLQQLHAGLPVVGSEIEVHAGDRAFVGLSGVLTRNLDGFDVATALGAEKAAEIARGDFAAVTAGREGGEVGMVELVILPRKGTGADLAWQVDLAGGWRYFVDANDGGILGTRLLAQRCGDGSCSEDETDDNCRQDCGCSAPGDLCGTFVPAPFGCWCDSDCAEAGDCCSDVAICELPPAPDGSQGAPCEWGEKDAGFFDGVRLNFYRMKYYAIAQGSILKDAQETREYLLHFLGNSGRQQEVDVDKMLEEIPTFRAAVDEKRTAFARQAAADAEAASATGRVTTPTRVEWDSAATDESFNWFFALGTWDYSQTGTVSVEPLGDLWSFDVEGQVHVSKHYGWDPSKKVGPGDIFDQSELYELHCYGWAQEFWIKGMSSKSTLQGRISP